MANPFRSSPRALAFFDDRSDRSEGRSASLTARHSLRSAFLPVVFTAARNTTDGDPFSSATNATAGGNATDHVTSPNVTADDANATAPFATSATSAEAASTSDANSTSGATVTNASEATTDAVVPTDGSGTAVTTEANMTTAWPGANATTDINMTTDESAATGTNATTETNLSEAASDTNGTVDASTQQGVITTAVATDSNTSTDVSMPTTDANSTSDISTNATTGTNASEANASGDESTRIDVSDTSDVSTNASLTTGANVSATDESTSTDISTNATADTNVSEATTDDNTTSTADSASSSEVNTTTNASTYANTSDSASTTDANVTTDTTTVDGNATTDDVTVATDANTSTDDSMPSTEVNTSTEVSTNATANTNASEVTTDANATTDDVATVDANATTVPITTAEANTSESSTDASATAETNATTEVSDTTYANATTADLNVSTAETNVTESATADNGTAVITNVSTSADANATTESITPTDANTTELTTTANATLTSGISTSAATGATTSATDPTGATPLVPNTTDAPTTYDNTSKTVTATRRQTQSKTVAMRRTITQSASVTHHATRTRLLVDTRTVTASASFPHTRSHVATRTATHQVCSSQDLLPLLSGAPFRWFPSGHPAASGPSDAPSIYPIPFTLTEASVREGTAMNPFSDNYWRRARESAEQWTDDDIRWRTPYSVHGFWEQLTTTAPVPGGGSGGGGRFTIRPRPFARNFAAAGSALGRGGELSVDGPPSFASSPREELADFMRSSFGVDPAAGQFGNAFPDTEALLSHGQHAPLSTLGKRKEGADVTTPSSAHHEQQRGGGFSPQDLVVVTTPAAPFNKSVFWVMSPVPIIMDVVRPGDHIPLTGFFTATHAAAGAQPNPYGFEKIIEGRQRALNSKAGILARFFALFGSGADGNVGSSGYINGNSNSRVFDSDTALSGFPMVGIAINWTHLAIAMAPIPNYAIGLDEFIEVRVDLRFLGYCGSGAPAFTAADGGSGGSLGRSSTNSAVHMRGENIFHLATLRVIVDTGAIARTVTAARAAVVASAVVTAALAAPDAQPLPALSMMRCASTKLMPSAKYRAFAPFAPFLDEDAADEGVRRSIRDSAASGTTTGGGAHYLPEEVFEKGGSGSGSYIPPPNWLGFPGAGGPLGALAGIGIFIGAVFGLQILAVIGVRIYTCCRPLTRLEKRARHLTGEEVVTPKGKEAEGRGAMAACGSGTASALAAGAGSYAPPTLPATEGAAYGPDGSNGGVAAAVGDAGADLGIGGHNSAKEGSGANVKVDESSHQLPLLHNISVGRGARDGGSQQQQYPYSSDAHGDDNVSYYTSTSEEDYSLDRLRPSGAAKIGAFRRRAHPRSRRKTEWSPRNDSSTSIPPEGHQRQDGYPSDGYANDGGDDEDAAYMREYRRRRYRDSSPNAFRSTSRHWDAEETDLLASPVRSARAAVRRSVFGGAARAHHNNRNRKLSSHGGILAIDGSTNDAADAVDAYFALHTTDEESDVEDVDVWEARQQLRAMQRAGLDPRLLLHEGPYNGADRAYANVGPPPPRVASANVTESSMLIVPEMTPPPLSQGDGEGEEERGGEELGVIGQGVMANRSDIDDTHEEDDDDGAVDLEALRRSEAVAALMAQIRARAAERKKRLLERRANQQLTGSSRSPFVNGDASTAELRSDLEGIPFSPYQHAMIKTFYYDSWVGACAACYFPALTIHAIDASLLGLVFISVQLLQGPGRAFTDVSDAGLFGNYGGSRTLDRAAGAATLVLCFAYAICVSVCVPSLLLKRAYLAVQYPKPVSRQAYDEPLTDDEDDEMREVERRAERKVRARMAALQAARVKEKEKAGATAAATGGASAFASAAVVVAASSPPANETEEERLLREKLERKEERRRRREAEASAAPEAFAAAMAAEEAADAAVDESQLTPEELAAWERRKRRRERRRREVEEAAAREKTAEEEKARLAEERARIEAEEAKRSEKERALIRYRRSGEKGGGGGVDDSTLLLTSTTRIAIGGAADDAGLHRRLLPFAARCPRFVQWLFFPKGVVMSVETRRMFSPLVAYSRDHPLWPTLPLWSPAVLTFFGSFPVRSASGGAGGVAGCIVLYIFMAFFHFLFALIVLVMGPFRHRSVNFLTSLNFFLTGVLVCLASTAAITEDGDYGNDLAFGAVVLSLLQMIFGVLRVLCLAVPSYFFTHILDGSILRPQWVYFAPYSDVSGGAKRVGRKAAGVGKSVAGQLEAIAEAVTMLCVDVGDDGTAAALAVYRRRAVETQQQQQQPLAPEPEQAADAAAIVPIAAADSIVVDGDVGRAAGNSAGVAVPIEDDPLLGDPPTVGSGGIEGSRTPPLQEKGEEGSDAVSRSMLLNAFNEHDIDDHMRAVAAGDGGDGDTEGSRHRRRVRGGSGRGSAEYEEEGDSDPLLGSPRKPMGSRVGGARGGEEKAPESPFLRKPFLDVPRPPAFDDDAAEGESGRRSTRNFESPATKRADAENGEKNPSPSAAGPMGPNTSFTYSILASSPHSRGRREGRGQRSVSIIVGQDVLRPRDGRDGMATADMDANADEAAVAVGGGKAPSLISIAGEGSGTAAPTNEEEEARQQRRAERRRLREERRRAAEPDAAAGSGDSASHVHVTTEGEALGHNAATAVDNTVDTFVKKDPKKSSNNMIFLGNHSFIHKVESEGGDSCSTSVNVAANGSIRVGSIGEAVATAPAAAMSPTTNGSSLVRTYSFEDELPMGGGVTVSIDNANTSNPPAGDGAISDVDSLDEELFASIGRSLSPERRRGAGDTVVNEDPMSGAADDPPPHFTSCKEVLAFASLDGRRPLLPVLSGSFSSPKRSASSSSPTMAPAAASHAHNNLNTHRPSALSPLASDSFVKGAKPIEGDGESRGAETKGALPEAGGAAVLTNASMLFTVPAAEALRSSLVPQPSLLSFAPIDEAASAAAAKEREQRDAAADSLDLLLPPAATAATAAVTAAGKEEGDVGKETRGEVDVLPRRRRGTLMSNVSFAEGTIDYAHSPASAAPRRRRASSTIAAVDVDAVDLSTADIAAAAAARAFVPSHDGDGDADGDDVSGTTLEMLRGNALHRSIIATVPTTSMVFDPMLGAALREEVAARAAAADVVVAAPQRAKTDKSRERSSSAKSDDGKEKKREKEKREKKKK